MVDEDLLHRSPMLAGPEMALENLLVGKACHPLLQATEGPDVQLHGLLHRNVLRVYIDAEVLPVPEGPE